MNDKVIHINILDILGEKMVDKESDYLLFSNKSTYPQPLTLQWRIEHSIGYLLGGTTFIVGSMSYFPWIANYSLGGWMFTIGSTGVIH